MEHTFNRLAPLNFRYYCQKVLPAVYDESLSYYELLCKLTAKVNELIATDNVQNDALTQLTKLVTNLQSYVTHYFDNLDVQTEINNKLDQMAQDDQLTQIIEQFLGTINFFGFQTKADLKAAQNLAAGGFVKTMGSESYQTGDGNYYYIRAKTQSDVPDDNTLVALTNLTTLIAEKIPDYWLNTLNTTVTTLSNNVGTLSSLNTDEKSSIVGAINWNKSKYNELIGDLSQLETTINSSVVGSINSLKSNTNIDIGRNTTNIGTMTNLNTSNKNDLVSAINEVNTKITPVTLGGTGANNAFDARENIGAIAIHTLFDSDVGTNGNIDFTSKLNDYGTQLNQYKCLTFFGYMNTDENQYDDGCISATVYNTDTDGYFSNRLNIGGSSSTTPGSKHYFKFAHSCYDVGTETNPNAAILVTSNGKTAVLSYDDENSTQMVWGTTWNTSNIYIYRVIGYI